MNTFCFMKVIDLLIALQDKDPNMEVMVDQTNENMSLFKFSNLMTADVVGIPDPIRTEAIKAWIVLRPGFTANDALAKEIQDFVKVQLAAHEYPRQIQFADSLPMTATGKVLRRELRTLG